MKKLILAALAPLAVMAVPASAQTTVVRTTHVHQTVTHNRGHMVRQCQTHWRHGKRVRVCRTVRYHG